MPGMYTQRKDMWRCTRGQPPLSEGESSQDKPPLLLPSSWTSSLQNCEGCSSHPAYGICYDSLNKLVQRWSYLICPNLLRPWTALLTLKYLISQVLSQVSFTEFYGEVAWYALITFAYLHMCMCLCATISTLSNKPVAHNSSYMPKHLGNLKKR